MFAAFLALEVLIGASSGDPFTFFQPTVTITADDRRQLDRGRAIARVLPGQDLEIAVLAAVPVNIDGDRLVAWMRQIGQLKKSAYVLAIRRFSDPLRIGDVADLMLDDDELSEILTCRPSRCGVKLSAAEMTELQRAAADGGAEWKTALQGRFRRIVLERVNAYLAAGEAGPYENHHGQVWPANEFARLLDHSAFLREHAPGFAGYLRRGPIPPISDVESFVYWSKERLADKPIVSVTHVNILRSHDERLPDVLIAAKQIFATHYINASLGLTALVPGGPGGPNYLVYVNRSEVDMLRGMFGGIIRWVLQRRLKAEAAKVLEGLRRRLESGEPPAQGAGYDSRRVLQQAGRHCSCR